MSNKTTHHFDWQQPRCTEWKLGDECDARIIKITCSVCLLQIKINELTKILTT